MRMPGMNRRPRPDYNDRYTKWGWYTMALIAAVWVIYELFYK
ncbi:hypothetical protein [Hymenobacter sp. J193]|nr:hypothetical protein [Hymenobacter sp. J193]